MALKRVGSRITERGHWEVTIQDENEILDSEGNDTGPVYLALVAKRQTWESMEPRLAKIIKQGRADKVIADSIINNLTSTIDLESLETEVGR